MGGRKKSLHPSDLLRKKERRKQLRKLQLQRQKARKNGLRKLAPEKLLQGIKKFNRMELLDGKLDERAGIKRKHLVAAYNDVVAKRKTLNVAKKDGVKIAGINKILGRQEEEREEEERTEERREEKDETDKRKKPEEGKEKEATATPLEDLEFPPGLPRPIHLVPPPGIRPRPQRQLQPKPVSVPTRTKNVRKTAVVQNFSAPSVQVLGRGNLLPNTRGKRKRGNPDDLFDPFNPENPFFAQHPKRQNMLLEKVKKLERLEMQRLQNMPKPPQPSPLPIGPSVPLQPGEYGPSGPTADMPSDLPALPEPGESGGKLEVLLSDTMLALRPTSVVVKRQEVSRQKARPERALELAPEVVAFSKAKRKKKKALKKGQTEYDQFLQEIESLGGML